MLKSKSIFVAVLNQGSIRVELSSLLFTLTQQGKYELIIQYPGEKPISYNRNKIVVDFLASDCDYLLMIDSDIIPPDNILNLADYQMDVVGALCFMYQQNAIAPHTLRKSPEGAYHVMPIKGDEGLIECDAIGTGCIMLSRKVLESIRAPFMNEYDADGMKKIGLDIAFCRRVKEKGYKTYCHLDYSCSHFVESDLKKVYIAIESRIRTIQKLEEELETLKGQQKIA